MRIVAEDSTIKFSFNTTRFSSGAPYTLAGTPSMHARVDGNATEITTGFTLSADFDSKTGENQVTLDLSASASYTAGSIIEIFIAAGTVDSVSVVGLKVYEFQIGTSGTIDQAITRGLLALPAAAPGSGSGLATATNVASVETDTQDIQSKIGTPSDLGGGASLAANLSDIEAQTDDIGAAGAGLTAVPWNAAWDAEVQSECADALGAYDPPTRAEATADKDEVLAGIAALPQDNTGCTLADDAITAGKFDQTTAFPMTTADGSDLTEVGGDGAQLTEAGGNGDHLTEAGGDGDHLTEAGGTGDQLTAVPWNAAWDAEVQSEVQDAIEANHLDHLLAADYDPSSKPGVSTALLNELVESDSGVSRFTANALEQAPSGGGGGGGSVTVASLEAAAIAQLAGITVTVSQPFRGTNEPLELVQGDDYSSDDDQEITVTITGLGASFDVSGASALLTLKKGSTEVGFTATGVTKPADDVICVFEPTAAETAGLDPAGDDWRYDVQITLASGNKVTPIRKAKAIVYPSYSE